MVLCHPLWSGMCLGGELAPGVLLFCPGQACSGSPCQLCLGLQPGLQWDAITPGSTVAWAGAFHRDTTGDGAPRAGGLCSCGHRKQELSSAGALSKREDERAWSEGEGPFCHEGLDCPIRPGGISLLCWEKSLLVIEAEDTLGKSEVEKHVSYSHRPSPKGQLSFSPGPTILRHAPLLPRRRGLGLGAILKEQPDPICPVVTAATGVSGADTCHAVGCNTDPSHADASHVAGARKHRLVPGQLFCATEYME